MQKIIRSVLFLAAVMAAVLTGCSDDAENGNVRQEDTQTTDVMTGSVSGDVVSQDIMIEEYLPAVCQKKDDELQKKLETGDYTWEKPLVVCNPYGNSPLTAYILFETKKACAIQVTVPGKNGAADISGTLKKTKKHRVPVIGLYVGVENPVKLTRLDEAGKKKETQTVKITTKKLPRQIAQAVKVEKRGKSSAYGLTMISGQTTKYPFAYDLNGDIRWYVTMTTGSYGIFPLSDNRLVCQTDASLTPTEEKPHTTQMYEMDYLGRVSRIYYVKNGIHHEVIEKTPGGNFFVLSSSIDGHTEDVVQEIDRETGEIVKSLDMREVFDDTYVNKVDWAHLNTVSYKEEDHSILLSPRNLHAAVKIDWETNEIKWILANPQMFEGTGQEEKVLKPNGNITWFFQQHSVYEIPYDMDGNPDTVHIMLYDNHWQTKRKVDFFDHGEQSFVMVFAVDEKNKTVRQEKLFPGVRSIITSNCAYDRESARMFSFGGYLHPFIGGQKGMIYEFQYDSREIVNQYSTKYYFYRGYGMKINWEDLGKPLHVGEDYVKGTLQAPVEKPGLQIPKEKIPGGTVGFTLTGSVLYMKTSDHAVSKIRFVGAENSYLMDYSSAGKGMKSKKNQKYKIAVPLSSLKADTYQIAVNYEGEWFDTGKRFEKR